MFVIALAAYLRVDGIVVGSRMLYKGACGSWRVPVMIGGLEGVTTISALLYILTECESKMAVQLLSQIWPTDSSEPEASFGKACDLVVAVLRFGMGSCAVAVDVMMLPFGTIAWTAGLESEIGQ